MTRRVRLASTAAVVGAVALAGVLVASAGEHAAVGPVTVTIEDELGSDEVSEDVAVSIDGRDADVLRVDARRPMATLTLRLARGGRHEYRTVARRQLKGKPPSGAGHSDHVEIDGRHVLTIAYDDEDRTYLEPR